MVLLAANSMHRPKHDNLSLDSHLVEIGLQTIDKMVKATKNKMLQSFQDTCTELHQRMQQRCAEAVVIANNVNCSSRSEDILYGIEGNSLPRTSRV
jgi:glycerate-2-kinase